MTPTLGLLLDGMVIILLVLTIGSVWRLSGRLKDFRKARAEFDALIARFDTATGRAETGIKTLEQASGRAGADLQEQISSARKLRDELRMMTEAADSLAKRLEAAVPSRGGTTTLEASSAKAPLSPAEPRSKAERDLMRAMEGKRQP